VRKDFINEVARTTKIERRDLIEKDLIIHQLLLDLSKDEFFSGRFLFKGGTCLIKGYLGYFRFSEDIDFTWRDQTVFEGVSQKEVRRYLSEVIDAVGKTFEEAAGERGLDFRCDKGDRKYVELGGGNKTATLKIWYPSEILNRRAFVKVQVNFVERLIYPGTEKKLKSLLGGYKAEELELLFPDEYGEYSKHAPPLLFMTSERFSARRSGRSSRGEGSKREIL